MTQLVTSVISQLTEQIKGQATSADATPKLAVLYIGVGCEVSRPTSLDQQLPPYLLPFTLPTSTKGGLGLVFDPKFYAGPPLFATLDSGWIKQGATLWVKGGVRMFVFPHYLELRAVFYESVLELLKAALTGGIDSFLGVFTQPYLMVEENHEVVSLYHRLLAVVAVDEAKRHLHYYHLAAYGTDQHATRVWMLNGERHDQDKALLKEVTRYKGPGPTFGVGCYAAFPGSKYAIRNPTSNAIDYHFIQQQVEEEEAKLDREALLAENEHFLTDLSKFLTADH